MVVEKLKQMVVMLQEMGYSDTMAESVDRIFDVIDEAAPKVATLMEMSVGEVRQAMLSSFVQSYILYVTSRYGESTSVEVWRNVVEGLLSVDVQRWAQVARLVEDALDEYGGDRR